MIESNTREIHIDQSEPGVWNDKNMSILSKHILCVRKRFAVASAYNLILIEQNFISSIQNVRTAIYKV